VPSTSSSSPLIIALRRADVRAFWVVTTAAVGAVLGVIALALGAGAPWVWALAALALPLPGLVWPEWLEIGVRSWNKAARTSMVVLREYTLRVGYFLLFAIVGRAGSGLEIGIRDRRPSEWISRGSHEAAFGKCDRLPALDEWAGREWLASLRKPGNAWQICLLPLVLLLLVLRQEGQESALPSGTYTLY
jgi:hypothetical protein